MQRHRFQEQLDQRRLPRPQAQPINRTAFCLCPPSLMMGAPGLAWLWQQRLYQMAFAEAQAVVRPSLPERDLLGVWN
jgi:hypothetical protein